MYYYLIIGIIIEYAWICLNKQGAEYVSGPKCAKILKWQSSEYGRVLIMRCVLW